MTGIWQRIRGTRPELSCVELVEIVTDYLEGGMDATQRRRFEAHLAEGDGCTNYVEQSRITIGTIGRVTPDDLSDAARASLLAVFRDYTRGSEA
jgi:hypothetical protein